MTDVEVSELKLQEKAALLSGQDFWSTQPVQRMGVPSLVLTDGPHGVRLQQGSSDHLALNRSVPATCFPPAVAVASSWDEEVAEAIGSAIGREARALGVHVVLGPGAEVKRSPLCGRNFEYYSEDPLLAGRLAAAHVRGQQSQGVGAAVKHFVANTQETERMRISADVDERTLREIYLVPFERVVTDSAPAMVMSSYNRLNGTYASENRWLLTDVLREGWGYQGTVVSDWGGVHDPVKSLLAGSDLEMPGTAGKSAKQIAAAVESGALDEAHVDAAVTRILALTGLARERGPAFDEQAHHRLARGLGARCAVLLKNDGATLPLGDSTSIAVIGEFARTPRFQGGGSSRIAATCVDVPVDEIRAVAAGRAVDVAFAPGYSLDGSGDASALREQAVTVAERTDVAIVFAGLPESAESEGFDRTHLYLPADQVELINAVAAVAPRTVVVLSNGGIVTVEDWHANVEAILESFLLGQASGGAIADLLFGIANPSGRLAETIPVRLADTPSHHNFPGEQGHVLFGERVMVGYRHHQSARIVERFPFGHGLSYTSFTTSGLQVDVTGNDTATVTVNVTNTGDRAGGHVVQVYVATEAGPVIRPARELRAFTKLHLEAGESQTVALDLDRRAFAYWDIDESGWVVTPGTYAVQVCQDAATVLAAATIELPGDLLVRELTMQSTVTEWFAHPAIGPTLLQDLTPTSEQRATATIDMSPELLRIIGSMPMQKVIDMLPTDVPEAALEDLMARSRPAVAPRISEAARMEQS